ALILDNPLDLPSFPTRRSSDLVFDLRTGTVVRAVATAWPLLGWYDDGHVVRVAPGTESAPVFEVLDIRSGEVTKRVPAPGLASCCVQLGSSAGLRGAVAELGF